MFGTLRVLNIECDCSVPFKDLFHKAQRVSRETLAGWDHAYFGYPSNDLSCSLMHFPMTFMAVLSLISIDSSMLVMASIMFPLFSLVFWRKVGVGGGNDLIPPTFKSGGHVTLLTC